MNRFARYAIPVAQDAILVARDGLKTVSIVAKILERFNQSMVKLVSSWPSALHRIYLKRLFLKRWGYINHISFMATLRFSNVSGLVSEKSIFLPFWPNQRSTKECVLKFIREIYPGIEIISDGIIKFICFQIYPQHCGRNLRNTKYLLVCYKRFR